MKTNEDILKANAGEFYIHVWEWQPLNRANPTRYLGDDSDIFTTIDDAVEGFQKYADDKSLTYLFTTSDKGVIDIRDYIDWDKLAGDDEPEDEGNNYKWVEVEDDGTVWNRFYIKNSKGSTVCILDDMLIGQGYAKQYAKKICKLLNEASDE